MVICMRVILSMGLAIVLAITANGQDLDLSQLQGGPPPGFGGDGAAPVMAGIPVFGYQFEYGSFFVQPGNPPSVQAIFVLTTQQFPLAGVQKLYHETLTYVGFNPSGPNEGAVFRASIGGNDRYFVFGTVSQGTQNGIQLRRVRYFDQNFVRTYSTIARFYLP
jgi:hypothetical protein